MARKSRSPSSRASIERSARLAVYERDGHRCQECGWSPEMLLGPPEPSDNFLTLDHIWPRSKGGSNRQENLRTLCFRCNHAKADAGGPRLPKRIYREAKKGRDDLHHLLPRFQAA